MTTAHQHYERHLAPIYVWMAGGVEPALRDGAIEIAALGLPLSRGDIALDLGAGFGMHAIPLARAGAKVTAIDSSTELLRTLTQLGAGLPVQAVNDELLNFEHHLAHPADAILCMGDTITHLTDFDAVARLVERVSNALRAGGVFVVSLRDYSAPLTGDDRFIHVRSDEARSLTCFLEYGPHVVRVHDIVHERTAAGWRSRVSHYPKLRLPPECLIGNLESRGFAVRRQAGPRGMVRLVAQRR
jgi:2-polyprenyl-3-methyl-5-hydroxy-6-metoxy-1,4-benzoquinol methylase